MLTKEQCWQKMLATVKKIEELNERKLYPEPRELKDRLFHVFKTHFDNQEYELLTLKANVLYRKTDNHLLKKVTTEKQLNAIKKELDEFVVDGHTLKYNFTKENHQPRRRFMDLMAIVYGKALDFNDFCKKCNDVPEGILGEWVSIVRSNDRQHLLLTPILIVREEGEYKAEMRSTQTVFKGTVFESNGCLQLFFGNDKKKLLLSFRIGEIKFPKVLQGTFSGISSSGAPIAGIEWLVRPNELPHEIEVPLKLQIDNGTTNWRGLPEKLQEIFRDFDKCYLKTNIDKINTCNWADLD
jgi:hypothetical protein